MISALGIACVTWTVYELIGLVRRANDARVEPVVATSLPEQDTRPRRRPRRPLEAWDDRGRSIHVEDLGRA